MIPDPTLQALARETADKIDRSVLEWETASADLELLRTIEAALRTVAALQQEQDAQIAEAYGYRVFTGTSMAPKLATEALGSEAGRMRASEIAAAIRGGQV